MASPPPRSPALLLVAATGLERDAAARLLVTAPAAVAGLDIVRAHTPAGAVDLLIGGVGLASAAATTATALAHSRYDLVLCIGIAGGFPPVPIGATVIGTATVQPELGAEDGPAFRSLSALGLGAERLAAEPAVVAELAARTGAHCGAILSVSTVTGSAETAHLRRIRVPDAAAEAMEGAGVQAAAAVHRVAFAEVRTISNAVGPRDRDAWHLGPALSALAEAIAAITASASSGLLSPLRRVDVLDDPPSSSAASMLASPTRGSP